jgi:hypothetical protein
MSWLSQAFDSIGNDVSSFWNSNSSWLPYALGGVAAIGTAGLLAPEIFAGLGAAEAGAGAAGAAGAGAAGDVAIDIAPFAGAAEEGAVEGAAEGAGAFTPGVVGEAGLTESAALPGTAAGLGEAGGTALESGGPLDFLAGTGASADTLAANAPVAGLDAAGSAGGLQGGVDVAGAQSEFLGGVGDLGGGSTPDVLAGTPGTPVGPYPTETAGQAFGAGRFGSFATPDLGVAQQDALSGGLIGQGPVPADVPGGGAPSLSPPTQVAQAPVAGTTADAAIGNPNPTISGIDRSADIGASSIGGAGPGGAPAGGGAPGGGTGGGGPGGFLNNPYVKAAELGVPLAVLGGNLLKGPDKLPGTTQANVGMANNLATYGATELNLANAGQINPAQEAQIQQNVQKQKAALYQSFVSRGVDPTSNSDYQQGLQQIDANATAQRAQFIQTMIQNALNADSQASAILTNASNQQIALDNSFNSAINGATQSFGVMAALSASRGGGGGGTAAAAAPTG